MSNGVNKRSAELNSVKQDQINLIVCDHGVFELLLQLNLFISIFLDLNYFSNLVTCNPPINLSLDFFLPDKSLGNVWRIKQEAASNNTHQHIIIANKNWSGQIDIEEKSSLGWFAQS